MSVATRWPGSRRIWSSVAVTPASAVFSARAWSSCRPPSTAIAAPPTTTTRAAAIEPGHRPGGRSVPLRRAATPRRSLRPAAWLAIAAALVVVVGGAAIARHGRQSTRHGPRTPRWPGSRRIWSSVAVTPASAVFSAPRLVELPAPVNGDRGTADDHDQSGGDRQPGRRTERSPGVAARRSGTGVTSRAMARVRSRRRAGGVTLPADRARSPSDRAGSSPPVTSARIATSRAANVARHGSRSAPQAAHVATCARSPAAPAPGSRSSPRRRAGSDARSSSQLPGLSVVHVALRPARLRPRRERCPRPRPDVRHALEHRAQAHQPPRVLVLTVPSGRPRRAAISTWVSPSS